jgi:ribonucleotide monophosphatase NagD (HAD superfamily)
MLTLSPPRIAGLSALAADYDAVLCDVWGVLHNGVGAFPGAPEALIRYRESGGKVVLLTNAPRPAGPIHEQLARLGVAREAYDDLLTSGDVTRVTLEARPERRVAHIGADADIVVITGLADDTRETPDDYRPRLAELAARKLPLICANPDIVVERGTQKVWCAGALARVYVDEFGGDVTVIGKPYAPVYAEARVRIQRLTGRPVVENRVLAIGDGLPTDIRGAWSERFDVLFITGGIHADDFGPHDAPDAKRVEQRLMQEDLAVTAFCPRLVW